MTQHTPPSIEVARTAAIANIYQQLGAMQFTCADDAYDASCTIARLAEAEAQVAKEARKARIPPLRAIRGPRVDAPQDMHPRA